MEVGQKWLEITIFLGAIIMSEIYVCEARYLWWAGGYVADDCSGKGFYCGHFLLCRSHHPPLLSLSLSASPPSHYLWVAKTILQKPMFQSIQQQKVPLWWLLLWRMCGNNFTSPKKKLLKGEICLWALQGVRGVHPERGGWYSGRTSTFSSSSWLFTSCQVMLDDHILKAQTMHSSAYIKPFEEEMKEWEDKLISMQVSVKLFQVNRSTSFNFSSTGHSGRLVTLPRVLAVPRADLQQRGHHEADACWGEEVQQGEHRLKITFPRPAIVPSHTRLTVSGGTSWPRRCPTHGCSRLPASLTCW